MKKIDHKEVYLDGKHYDALNVHDFDIPFYLKQAKQCKGEVLELACGTGRIAIPLANEGINISGIDVSEGMIKQAKEIAKKQKVDIDFKVLDIRNFDLNKKFALIYLPFNSICHIHDFESIKALFNTVKKHLESNGKFIMSVFKPNMNLLIRKKDEVVTNDSYTNPYNNTEVKHTENNYYNSADQVNYINWIFEIDKKTEKIPINMRMFFPQELDNYLKFSNFEIINKFGDYAENDFNENSNQQIIVCKAK